MVQLIQKESTSFKLHAGFCVIILACVIVDMTNYHELNRAQYNILIGMCIGILIVDAVIYLLLPYLHDRKTKADPKSDNKTVLKVKRGVIQRICKAVELGCLEMALINYDQGYLMDFLLLFLMILSIELLLCMSFWENWDRYKFYAFIALPLYILSSIRTYYVHQDMFDLVCKLCMYTVIVVLMVLIGEIADRQYDAWIVAVREREEAMQEVYALKEKQEKQLKIIQKSNEELCLKNYEIERANQNMISTNRQLDAQYRIGTAVLQTLDVDEIIELLLQAFLDDMEMEAAAVRLLAGTVDNKDRLVVDISLYSEVKPDEFEKQVRSRDEEFMSMEQGSYIVEDKILVIPVFKEEEQVGYLYMFSTEDGYYDKHEVNVFLNLAMQFRVGLTNANLYRKTQEMALKDGLTKIYNRRYLTNTFEEKAKEAMLNESKLSVLMMDIDKFKNINDTYGHLIGDKVLIEVASIANTITERFNGFVGRYGGEEFVVVLPGYALEEAEEIGKEIHQSIGEASYRDDAVTVRFTVSMGISNYPETCEEASELIAKADCAMYYSKTHGRNCITVDGRFDKD